MNDGNGSWGAACHVFSSLCLLVPLKLSVFNTEYYTLKPEPTLASLPPRSTLNQCLAGEMLCSVTGNYHCGTISIALHGQGNPGNFHC